MQQSSRRRFCLASNRERSNISGKRVAQDEESGWSNRRSLGKNEKEIEAEAVAYLVASRAVSLAGSARTKLELGQPYRLQCAGEARFAGEKAPLAGLQRAR